MRNRRVDTVDRALVDCCKEKTSAFTAAVSARRSSLRVVVGWSEWILRDLVDIGRMTDETLVRVVLDREQLL